MGAVASVQIGAAIATTLFDELGPAGTVLLRTGFAAVVLVLLWRPSLRGRSRVALRDAVLFGLALAGMNLSFYAALDRIPLGIAVTLEFTGPFLVAVAGVPPGERPAVGGPGRRRHRAARRPAFTGRSMSPGRCWRSWRAAFWAAYIVLAARIGRAFSGGQGLSIAMVVATVVLLPSGIVAGGSDLGDPGLLAAGFAVAMLSSAIPYSLELEALRRLPKGTFGVLMSLEPAVAALVGLIALGQDLSANEVVAIGLVVAAERRRAQRRGDSGAGGGLTGLVATGQLATGSRG